MGDTMLLSMAESGENVEIKRISGKDETRRHLAGMGFIEGQRVTVISELAGGLDLRDQRCPVSLSTAAWLTELCVSDDDENAKRRTVRR